MYKGLIVKNNFRYFSGGVFKNNLVFPGDLGG